MSTRLLRKPEPEPARRPSAVMPRKPMLMVVPGVSELEVASLSMAWPADARRFLEMRAE